MKAYYVNWCPILGINQQIFAYEVSIKENVNNEVKEVHGVFDILNFFNQCPIENIIGQNLGYIKLDENSILDDSILLIPKDRFVIEISQIQSVLMEFKEKLEELKSDGYVFSLNLLGKNDYKKFIPIHKIFSFVRTDLSLIDKERVLGVVDFLKKFSDKIVIDNVQSHEEFEYLKKLGVTYFKGNFFTKPMKFVSGELEPNQLGVLKILNLINKNENLNKLDESLKAVPDIALNLIKFVNSASFGLKNKVKSIKDAIRLLGYNKLKTWLLVSSYADKTDPNTSPIFQTSVVRGKLMEILSEKLNIENRDSAFLVGMLSLIDTVFQKSKVEILDKMNVDEDIKKALMEKSGTLGQLLQIIEFDEAKDFSNFKSSLISINMAQKVFFGAKLDSYIWLRLTLKSN